MINTIELENYLFACISTQESADFTKNVVLPISEEYYLYITSEEKPNRQKDLLHTKEHFNKTFYMYLMDREVVAQ